MRYAADATKTHRTHAAGPAQMPVTQGHSYVLDSAGFAPLADETEPLRRTCRAAPSFAVPE